MTKCMCVQVSLEPALIGGLYIFRKQVNTFTVYEMALLILSRGEPLR